MSTLSILCIIIFILTMISIGFLIYDLGKAGNQHKVIKDMLHYGIIMKRLQHAEFQNNSSLVRMVSTTSKQAFIARYSIKYLAILLLIAKGDLKLKHLKHTIHELRRAVISGHLSIIEHVLKKVQSTFIVNLSGLISEINLYPNFDLKLNQPYNVRQFMSNLEHVIDNIRKTLLHITEENKILDLVDHRLNNYMGDINCDIMQDIQMPFNKKERSLDILIINNYGIFPIKVMPYLNYRDDSTLASKQMTTNYYITENTLKHYRNRLFKHHISNLPIMTSLIYINAKQMRVTGQVSNQACFINTLADASELYKLIGLETTDTDKPVLSDNQVAVITNCLVPNQSTINELNDDGDYKYFQINSLDSFIHDCKYVYGFNTLYQYLNRGGKDGK